MKSYWIAGTILLVATWPSGTKAYATGAVQSPAVEKPAQQVQSSTPAPAAPQETGNDALQTTQPAAGAAPNATAAPAASPQSTSAQNITPQNKGSYLLVELSKGLKVKKLKPGDKVKAEVTQDVVSHGKVIIPVETELIGHVTEVSVRDEGNPESRLGIVFDRIVLKHYHDINCQAVVQALAPPVIKRSRVDQPSQMLPPSMMGGGVRQSSAGSTGRSGGSSSSRGAPTAMSSSNSIGYQAPLTVKQSPTTSVTSGTSAAQLDVAPGGKPLSIGMPQGVTGLKGLSLSAGPTTSTPGPLIVSSTDNVKLEPGTQILLRVLRVDMPTEEKK
jgi:biotin carboxyl carrier protein